jgi:hypothetical protein
MFGLRDADMPAGADDFDAYMNGMLEGDDLYITPRARRARRADRAPPARAAARPAGARARQPDHGRAAARAMCAARTG